MAACRQTGSVSLSFIQTGAPTAVCMFFVRGDVDLSWEYVLS